MNIRLFLAKKNDERPEYKGTNVILLKAFNPEFIRFVGGGLISLVICYGSLYILVEIIGFHYLIGVNFSTLITLGFSYVINKYMVFKDHTKKHIKQGGRFILLQILFILLSNIFVLIQVNIMGINYFIAVLILSPIFAIANYLIQKTSIFKKSRL